MKTVFVVDLESVSTRYTCEWKWYVPELLQSNGLNVQIVDGPTDIPAATTPGAFLNFGGTNIYKAAQVEKMGRLFCEGKVKDGDYFLFTDAWHPGIINLKYMAELLGIKVKIGACWHAGSYDPHDFLGRLIGNKPWVRNTERALFDSIDHNFFATRFHVELFAETYAGDLGTKAWSDFMIQSGKIVLTGWPMDYMPKILEKYKGAPKRDLVLFPHRIAPEKQPEIFKHMRASMPNYEFVICQERQLTKATYHSLLAEAKIVFSCSLQETLGISPYEGAILGAVPLLPDRLSYTEMYDKKFKYKSEWTSDHLTYINNAYQIQSRIEDIMENYDKWVEPTAKLADNLTAKFFSAGSMVEAIKCS